MENIAFSQFLTVKHSGCFTVPGVVVIVIFIVDIIVVIIVIVVLIVVIVRMRHYSF